MELSLVSHIEEIPNFLSEKQALNQYSKSYESLNMALCKNVFVVLWTETSSNFKINKSHNLTDNY